MFYICFIKLSVEHDLMSLTALGMKLLCSLELRQQVLLYLLSDGSRVSRQWLGHLISPVLYRSVPAIFWVGFNHPL